MRLNCNKIVNKTRMPLIGIFLLATVFALPALADTNVSIGNFDVPPNGNVNGTLMANNVTDFVSASINISYDPSVVIINNVYPINPAVTLLTDINNTIGLTRILAEDPTTNGISGNIVLANISFTAVGTAGSSSKLTIVINQMLDKNFSDILATSVNGTFNITEASTPVITDFKVVPNTSINETNPAVLSANVTKAADGSLNEVSFGIVDSNDLIGNDGQILAEHRNFSGVEGLYKTEWHAHYHMIANATMSDNISVRDESDFTGYLIAIGSFKTNSTSNEIEDNALLWFNDTTLNLSNVTTRFIYGAVPLQIEDGNSTFHALIFKFNESGNMTVEYTSDKIFSLYNLTGSSSSNNPHLTRKNVPDGKYTAYVAAYGNNMSATVKTVDIGTMQPSVFPPVAIFNISGFKLNAADNMGIADWKIMLLNVTTGLEIENTTTDSTGFYNFTGLANGTYNVTEEMKSGWKNVSPMSLILTINGMDMINENFTNAMVPAATFNISGFKLNAADNMGIADWKIMLLNVTTGLEIENTTTDSTGFYNFTGLANGTYNVTEEMKSGWKNVSPMSLILTINGMDMINENFTNSIVPAATFNISGFKHNAADNMGIADWKIMLLNVTTGLEIENTTTDSTGFYNFTGLANGTYNVTEEMKSGWTNVSPMSLILTINGMDMMNENFTNSMVIIEAPVITSFNPSILFVPNNVGDTRTFNITVNQTVDVTWYLNGTAVSSDSGVTESFYTNTSAAQGTWNVSATASNENGTVMQTWEWDVAAIPPAEAPHITSFNPPSPVMNNVSESRTFNITINQTVDVTWYLNGIAVSSDSGVTTSSYTNTSAAQGTWNVTAVASNANGTDMKMWEWIVTSPPLKNTISGYVINDVNGNGIQDAGEIGLSGWSINLIGLGGSAGVNKVTTTDAQGFYIFENLPAGNYMVLETLQGGYIMTTTGTVKVTMLEDGMNAVVNFTNRPILSPANMNIFGK